VGDPGTERKAANMTHGGVRRSNQPANLQVDNVSEVKEAALMITSQELTERIDMASVEEVDLTLLKFDTNMYSRVSGIDQVAVADYSKKIAFLPPITVNQNDIIVDGVHRYKAALRAEQTRIAAKRIQLDDADIQLAGLLVDLRSGIRHPEKDVKAICIKRWSPDPAKNRALWAELEVPESTGYEWTADIRRAQEKQVNEQMALSLLDPYKTQEKIAEEFRCDQASVSRLKSDILCKILAVRELHNLPQNEREPARAALIQELQNQNLDFMSEYVSFEPCIYNIWNQSGADEANDYFGQFPIAFMKNLIYYHTEPFDLVYDPCAGGGTTIDACRFMYRQCIATDLTPRPDRSEIAQWDIAEGVPPDIPKPDMVFLDPPYWKQAQGRYPDLPGDLANMELPAFYDVLGKFISAVRVKRIKRVAIVIAATQYDNDIVYEDHIFEIASRLLGKYRIEMRCILPYSTQQYNATQVKRAKESGVCLTLHRDLVVFKRIDASDRSEITV